MNTLGGTMGGAPVPMMNNGATQSQPNNPAVNIMPAGIVRSAPTADRSQLNKYIYDYFCRYNMWDCARALYNTDNSVGIKTDSSKNPTPHHTGSADDSMDTDNKDDLGMKQPDDLPAAAIINTAASDTVFLYEWFCLFWDMYHAQRNKNGNGHIHQYVSHTQAQSRLKHAQQQEMLRQIRPDLANPLSFNMQHIQALRLQNPNAVPMGMKPNGNLARTAMANNQIPPQGINFGQSKTNQRDTAEAEAMRHRASSPVSDNASSPSKRPRLEGGPFNSAQSGTINGRQAGSMSNQAHPAHSQPLMATGMQPQNMAPGHMQPFPGPSQVGQAKSSIQSYSQTLQQHHGSQMPTKPGPNSQAPPPQGSPEMVTQAPQITAYYNAPGTLDTTGRMGAGGASTVHPGGGNHALQDYQMQLMLLEQQNKKRLLMARQEQDNIVPMARDGSNTLTQGSAAVPNGGPVGNGQFADTTQMIRPSASPNSSTEQMKRGTPQMNTANMPSPLPDATQARDSPTSVPFAVNTSVDTNGQPQQFNMMQMNPMRSGGHMAQPMGTAIASAQQQVMARQQPTQSGAQHATQQAQNAGQNGPQWQQNQVQGQNQSAPPIVPASASHNQIQSTPQQRSMPPPHSSTTVANTSPSMQARPPTPKSKRRDGESKSGKNTKGTHVQKKTLANSTRSQGDSAGEPEATPVTPVTPANTMQPFQKSITASNAGITPVSGSDTANLSSAAPQHPEPSQQGPSFSMDNTGSLPVEFPVDFGNGPLGNHMIEDFDFESFLHDDNGEPNTFDFNATFTTLEGGGEIGTTE